MKIVYLLPMKGNSERVPDKNMKPFGGRPLYHAILDQIRRSRFMENIFVDTDSDRISEDIRKNFPEVIIIDRPADLQGDDVSMNRIIQYDLSVIKSDYFLQTHSTNPLLKKETIDKAVEFFFDNQDTFDSIFGVNRIQSRLYFGDGTPINHDPEKLIKTQDLPTVYEENSNLYIFSRESFGKAGNRRIGKKPYMYQVPHLESFDIDWQEDFELAELIYRNRKLS